MIVESYTEITDKARRLVCDAYKSDEGCRWCPFRDVQPYEKEDCLFTRMDYSLRKLKEEGRLIDV